MAKTKTKGSTRQHKQRPGKRLGFKLFGSQKVKPGNIILRQRGSKFHSGQGTGMGKDFTIYALKEGVVSIKKKQGKKSVYVA